MTAQRILGTDLTDHGSTDFGNGFNGLAVNGFGGAKMVLNGFIDRQGLGLIKLSQYDLKSRHPSSIKSFTILYESRHPLNPFPKSVKSVPKIRSQNPLNAFPKSVDGSSVKSVPKIR